MEAHHGQTNSSGPVFDSVLSLQHGDDAELLQPSTRAITKNQRGALANRHAGPAAARPCNCQNHWRSGDVGSGGDCGVKSWRGGPRNNGPTVALPQHRHLTGIWALGRRWT